MTFQDEVVALRQQVEELQAMGVDKIVALGHSGFIVDQEVARRVGGIDVVIGGHSNTFLYNGRECFLFLISSPSCSFSPLSSFHPPSQGPYFLLLFLSSSYLSNYLKPCCYAASRLVETS